MDKINPALYIVDTDPATEVALNSSNWYEWQYCEIYDDDQIPWLRAQGWIVYWGPSSALGPGGTTVTTWKLKRRVLNPELALNALISSYTGAYNEGRQINDQRYDEIVSIYAVMLDRTETSITALEASESTYEALVEAMVAGLTTDYDSHATATNGAFSTFGTSETARVNLAFDNRLASMRQELVSRGMYNSTTYDSMAVGIERERAVALNDLNDKLLDKQVSLADRLYSMKVSLRTNILAARDRLRSWLEGQDLARVSLRNQVLSAMLAFMERRDDTYPDLGIVAQLTNNLGANQPTYSAP